MGKNNEVSQPEFKPTCFRCSRVIKPDDKMFIILASIENEPVNSIKEYVISSLCFPCASAVLTEAVINKKLTMPLPVRDLLDNEEEYPLPADQRTVGVVNQAGTITSTKADSDGSEYPAALSFQVHDDGFRLSLQCTDGISWATSELFTWSRIAQLLIAANPDMFGVLDEPLHYVFAEALASLGYNVPDWPE
jgi:hypothetical protein